MAGKSNGESRKRKGLFARPRTDRPSSNAEIGATGASASSTRSRSSKATNRTEPTGAASRAAVADRPSADQVRERAYYIYLERNGGPGDETADWLRAENELCGVGK